MNAVTINGTVWRPELRVTNSGTAVLGFDLSFYESKDASGTVKYGSIKVKAFKALAENASKKLADKSKVLVSGKLSHEEWEKDGQKHYRVVLLANDIAEPISQFKEQENQPQLGDEDIPF